MRELDCSLNAQVAIPVFDGLLPEPHNTHVLKLLFELAHWHGLAKLRMHTDVTLELLSQVTISFGARIRAFQEKTCAAFSTHELEREQAARVRRQDKKKKAAAETRSDAQKGKKATAETKSNDKKGTKATAKTNSQPQKSSSGKQPKQFNLNTYKYHSLADYCNTIRRFGTTDSYSTQPVGLF